MLDCASPQSTPLDFFNRNNVSIMKMSACAPARSCRCAAAAPAALTSWATSTATCCECGWRVALRTSRSGPSWVAGHTERSSRSLGNNRGTPCTALHTALHCRETGQAPTLPQCAIHTAAAERWSQGCPDHCPHHPFQRRLHCDARREGAPPAIKLAKHGGAGYAYDCVNDAPEPTRSALPSDLAQKLAHMTCVAQAAGRARWWPSRWWSTAVQTIGRQLFHRLLSICLLPHAGRWKGALVAIKVVEHSNAAGKVDVIEGARESLLAASVSHPNVIVRMTGSTGRSPPAWLSPAQHQARCLCVGTCWNLLPHAVLTCGAHAHLSACVRVQRRMPAAEPAGNSMWHTCRRSASPSM